MRRLVYKFKYWLCACCVLVVFRTQAQEEEGDPLAAGVIAAQSRIPLDTPIHIRLLSRDTTAFDYYSLYAFEYMAGNEKQSGNEFMIPRKDDIYKNKAQQTVEIRLCKFTHFINSWQGTMTAPIEVGDFIEITKDNGKDKQYYNFDTSLPHAVYAVCATKEQNTNKR